MQQLVVDVSIYMQQMTSADNIFRCIFFVAGEGLKAYAIFKTRGPSGPKALT